MCGIAGIFTRDARTPDAALARAMIATLVHRGPDAQSVVAESHIALGAARLAIVDVSEAANQPISDASGDLTIVFNGEIYNFKEIRTDLEQRGHRFRTHSDTEVVLSAYREWGLDCHARFNGMWAFALWDRREKKLVLSRDRFSVKPLYIAEMDGNVFFGSEIKALLGAGIPSDLASDAFHHFFGGESMFARIRPLPPATWIEYSVASSQPKQRTWWNTADTFVSVAKKRDARAEALRELLFDAVRVRLRVDVKPAFTLSGGLDSSSVFAAYAKLHRENRVRSATLDAPLDASPFVMHFPGSAIDEGNLAATVASHFGAAAMRLPVTPDHFRDLVTRITWHQEGLVWNSSVIAYHELFRQIAERGFRVVVEGHGGDELFAGYITFAEDALRHRIRRLRLLGAWSAARAAARTRNPVLGHSGVSALRGLAGALYHSVIPPKTPRKSFLSTMFEIDLFPEPGEQQFAAAIPGLSPLKRALYGAFHSRVLPTILRVSDRSTMAYSVESRSPFLDHRIVSYAFSLPDDDLIGAGWTKRILREAMSPLLPESIVWRARKLPFIVPQPEWFRQPAVLDAMRQALHDGTIARAPGLNRETFAAMLMRGAQHGFGWRDSTLMWTAYSYAIWSELFRVGNVRARSVTAASI